MSTAGHQKFVKRLKISETAVFKAALYFHQNGYTVQVPSRRICPDASQWKEYTDDGDLMILTEEGWLRVEVKCLNRDFTSAKDYPFRKIIVCACESFDRADPMPYMYMHFNRSCSHFALTKTSSKEHWESRLIHDKYYGDDYYQDMYLCPLEYVEFRSVQVDY